MRIAMFSDDFPVPGGPTNVVRGLSKALSEQHQVTILAHGKAPKSWMEGEVVVRVFGSRFRLSGIGLVSLSLLRHLRRRGRYDLVILNGAFSPAVVLPFLAARLGGSAIVHCPNNLYSAAAFERSRLLKRLYWYLVERTLLRSSDAVQVCTVEQQEQLRALSVNSKSIVIPNGIDDDLINRQPTSRSMEGVPVFGYLGRADFWGKGFDLLLHALQESVDAGAIFRVEMVLSQGDRKQLMDAVTNLRAGSLVTLMDPIDRSEVFDQVSHWDAYVHPSRADSFSLAVLEAMACARPVVSTTAVGSAEHILLANCGIVTEPTREGFSNGIKELMDRREDWVQMGLSGRAHLEGHLTWDRIGEAASRDYEEIVRIRRREMQLVPSPG